MLKEMPVSAMKPAVSDATPIRYLAGIRTERLLPYLFGKVFIPDAVFCLPR